MSFLRRRYKKIGKSLLCLLMAALMMQGFAAGAGEEAAAGHGGYLVRLDLPADVSLLSAQTELEPVVMSIGLYQVPDLETLLLLQDAGVLLSAEENWPVHLLDLPDDHYAPLQWEIPAIGVESAWSAGLDGTGVRIGIIDSGLMREHEDLAGANILEGYDYTSDSTDVTDEVGHGTFVTGIIAARRGNGVGVAGLAPGAEIVPLKFFSRLGGSLGDLVAAIWDAVDVYACDIINLSVSVDLPSRELEAAVNHAMERGCAVVAAVGNDGNSRLIYPAAYAGVIGVGSVDADLQCSWFSQRNASVTVVAPGSQLMGLATREPYFNGGDMPYEMGGGTSYSAPMVAAALAIALQADPTLTPELLRGYLALSSVDLGEEGWDEEYGYGLLDIGALLEQVARGPVPTLWEEDGTLRVRGYTGLENGLWDAVVAFYGSGGRMLSVQPVGFDCWLRWDGAMPPGAVRAKVLIFSPEYMPAGLDLTWEDVPAA